MNKINIALIRLFQFVVFALFTFMVLAYFGAMILVPLDLVVLILKVLGVVGIDGIIGVVIALPIVGYLGKIAYETPGLIKIIVDTGLDLVATGKSRVESFNKILADVKN